MHICGCEESWSWFLVMWVNFLVIDFPLRAIFKAVIVCNTQQWCCCMDQTFKVLQEALCEALCRSPAKRGSSSHGRVKWLTKHDNSSETNFCRFLVRFSCFGWFSQVLQGPERRQTNSEQCALKCRDYSEFKIDTCSSPVAIWRQLIKDFRRLPDKWS